MPQLFRATVYFCLVKNIWFAQNPKVGWSISEYNIQTLDFSWNQKMDLLEKWQVSWVLLLHCLCNYVKSSWGLAWKSVSIDAQSGHHATKVKNDHLPICGYFYFSFWFSWFSELIKELGNVFKHFNTMLTWWEQHFTHRY